MGRGPGTRGVTRGLGPGRGVSLDMQSRNAGSWKLVAAIGALASVGVVYLGSGRPAAAGPPPAYVVEPLPVGIDSLTTLAEATERISACSECEGVLYLWSPRMPLSRRGIGTVHEAARDLGVSLTLLGTDDLADYAERGADPAQPLFEALLRAGALAHAPALVVHVGGEPRGAAILGYKTADAYRSIVSSRLRRRERGSEPAHSLPDLGTRLEVVSPPVDHVAVGVPGAYFRWVPGRGSLAYESRRRIYLLDLEDGLSRVGPGYIDFVPTPDGQYFVTPAPNDQGLTFYDADEVFDASRREQSGAVQPIFTDSRMRDQYPSVGILEREGDRTRYRVLTSWFEGIVYRDYDVFRDARSSRSSVRPVGRPVVPCEGYTLSTPIMSQDGSEVAARDEATATTKLFRMLGAGRCEEVLDLGIQTSKVAWHQSGRRLAFRVPRMGSAGSGAAGGAHGIFVYDRDAGTLTGVEGSEDASRLAFPDFVGDDSIAFLVPGRNRRESSVFRVVDGIR